MKCVHYTVNKLIASVSAEDNMRHSELPSAFYSRDERIVVKCIITVNCRITLITAFGKQFNPFAFRIRKYFTPISKLTPHDIVQIRPLKKIRL